MLLTSLTCILGFLIPLSGGAGGDESPGPFAVDGWEEYPAPMIDAWLVLGPLETALLDELADPAKLMDHPRAGQARRGLQWQLLDDPVGATDLPPDRAARGKWTLAHAYVNLKAGKECHLNFSYHGARRARVYRKGEKILELTPPATRRAQAPLTLDTGWNPIQVALEGDDGSSPGFFFQITSTDGKTEILYSLPQLTDKQIELLGTGFSLGGRVWQRFKARQIKRVAASLSDYNRRMALLSTRVDAGSTRREDVNRRLRIAREVVRLIGQGGPPVFLQSRYQIVLNQFRNYKGFDADESDARERIVATIAEIRPWLDPHPPNSVAWNPLDGSRNVPELLTRIGITRRLVDDLLDYGRMLVSETAAGL